VPKLVAILVAPMMLLAACGSGDPTPASGESGGDGQEMEMGGDQFALGEPGDPEAADRTIDISALDSLEFEPDSITVEAGETISFAVSNEGKNVHEFVLGDEAYQQEHAAEMSDGEDMEADVNQIEIEPGETETLTWMFTDAAEVLFGCHEPGHYEGGMVGSIEVSS
jgi:uncharacterized cupredoxin-like copper-binding protein